MHHPDGYDMLHYLECISQGPALQECILISCPLSYRQIWDHEEIQELVKSFKRRLGGNQSYRECVETTVGTSTRCQHAQCDNTSIMGTSRDDVKQVALKGWCDPSSTRLLQLITTVNSC